MKIMQECMNFMDDRLLFTVIFSDFHTFLKIAYMKRKNFISLTVAVVFFVLACSGILLYVKQKAHFIEMTHTIFGLMFVSFAIFHIVNNWGSLKSYSKERQTGSIRKELIAALLIGGVILTLSVTEVLEPVAEFGKIFAAPKKGGGPQQVSFEEKTTMDSTGGKTVMLFLQKKKQDMKAVMDISVADTTGKVLETLLSSEGKEEGPAVSLMLHTKISTPPPFKLIISSNYEGDKKSSEVLVRSLAPGIQPLEAGSSSMLERAFLESK
jgi:hypothetical protein